MFPPIPMIVLIVSDRSSQQEVTTIVQSNISHNTYNQQVSAEETGITKPDVKMALGNNTTMSPALDIGINMNISETAKRAKRRRSDRMRRFVDRLNAASPPATPEWRDMVNKFKQQKSEQVKPR